MRSINHILGHLLSCKDATRVVSQGQDRPLSAFERWKLRMHLAVCEKCTRFERQLRFMREALRKYRS
ncbi:MAG TPA: zf-HC2 domain-containing protein [Casimicrobiaceae bacterium]|nr:zf-HC2 domain-containing protein [Casimicrobiaceae bacterium]